MNRPLLAAIGLGIGFAAAARADVNWTTNMVFAQGTSGPPLLGNSRIVTSSGTYTFIVRAGIFDLTGLSAGQSHQGLSAWSANVTTVGLPEGSSLSVEPLTSRMAPFDHGPATLYGGTITDPGRIDNILAQRDLSGGASAPWQFGFPQPTAPTPGALGLDSFTNVFRFSVTISSYVNMNLYITFTGQAGPVIGWNPFSSVEPLDPDTLGHVNFTGVTPQPALRDYAPITLHLYDIPSPGGAALFVIAAPPLMRRRRTSPRPLG